MKRLLSFLVILTLLFCAHQSARAQDDMAPPPPQDNGPGPGDQPPPPDQGGGPDQNAQDQGDQNQDAPDQGGDPGVSYQTFYDNLSDQGTWVQTDDYGYAFQPTVSDPNWAPYTDGHWVYTDQGWTWVSDEPWGWATYHYGRWVNIDGTGWCWVPGYRWAPAWVSWRYGGGYCGWAPLPPSTFIGVEFGGDGGGFRGYHFGDDIDVNFGIGAGCYNFVEIGHMGDPNIGPVIVNRYNNYGIINRTTNITNININGGGRGANGFAGVRVGGPPLAEINARSTHQIPTMRLAAAGGPGRAAEAGGAVSFYAPRVNASSRHLSRPASVARTISHATINRGDSISRPLAVSSNVRPVAPNAEEIQKARMAQSQTPASARIATSHTHPKVSGRLTGLAPVGQTGAGSVNRTQTFHPTGTQIQHTQTTPAYHPQAEGNQGTRNTETPAYQSQEQVNPDMRHTETAPVYHPPAESAPAVNRTEAAPAYHPETDNTGEVEHAKVEHHEATRTEGEGTAPSYHPEAQHTEQHHTDTHPPAPAPHVEPAKPANKKDDNKQ